MDDIWGNAQVEDIDNLDINDWIKQDREKKKGNKWLVSIFKYILIICVFIIWIHFLKDGLFGRPNSLFKEKKIEQVSYENTWSNVKDVKVIKIPQSVYDSMDGDERKDYLLGDKKRIMFIYRDGCPYAREFYQSISSSIKKDMLSTYYDTAFIRVPQTEKIYCSHVYCTNNKKNCWYACPSAWFRDVCWWEFCIVNPASREVIVDESQSETQISILLNSYKNRLSESLF